MAAGGGTAMVTACRTSSGHAARTLPTMPAPMSWPTMSIGVLNARATAAASAARVTLSE